jgi:hypothetical protein
MVCYMCLIFGLVGFLETAGLCWILRVRHYSWNGVAARGLPEQSMVTKERFVRRSSAGSL